MPAHENDEGWGSRSPEWKKSTFLSFHKEFPLVMFPVLALCPLAEAGQNGIAYVYFILYQ